jgi:propionate CoA-transferase
MRLEPIVSRPPKPMDARIFRSAIIGLKDDLLSIPIEARFSYDDADNLFFLNLEGLSVTSAPQLEAIRAATDERLAAIGRRVYAIVNYDNVYIAPELLDQYTDAVSRTAERHYLGVTRYTTSSFMRLKLGHVLAGRDVAPHIHESRREATMWLRRARAATP